MDLKVFALAKSVHQSDSGSYHQLFYFHPPISFSAAIFHLLNLHSHSIILSTSIRSHYFHSRTKKSFSSLTSAHFDDPASTTILSSRNQSLSKLLLIQVSDLSLKF